MNNIVVTIILFGVMVCAADVIYKNLNFFIMRHRAMKAWEKFKADHPEADEWQEYEAGAQDYDISVREAIKEQNIDDLTGNVSVNLHLKDEISTRLKTEANAAEMSISEYTNKLMRLNFDILDEEDSSNTQDQNEE